MRFAGQSIGRLHVVWDIMCASVRVSRVLVPPTFSHTYLWEDLPLSLSLLIDAVFPPQTLLICFCDARPLPALRRLDPSFSWSDAPHKLPLIAGSSMIILVWRPYTTQLPSSPFFFCLALGPWGSTLELKMRALFTRGFPQDHPSYHALITHFTFCPCRSCGAQSIRMYPSSLPFPQDLFLFSDRVPPFSLYPSLC